MAQKRNPVSLRLQTRLHGREKRFASSWFTDLFYPQLCTFDTRIRLYIGHLFDKGGNWSSETSETHIPETCLGVQFSYRRCSILSVILNREKEETDCIYSLNQNIRKSKTFAMPSYSLTLETNLLRNSTNKKSVFDCRTQESKLQIDSADTNTFDNNCTKNTSLQGSQSLALEFKATPSKILNTCAIQKQRSWHYTKQPCIEPLPCNAQAKLVPETRAKRCNNRESLSTIFSSKWSLIRFMLSSRYENKAFRHPHSNFIKDKQGLSKKENLLSVNTVCKSRAFTLPIKHHFWGWCDSDRLNQSHVRANPFFSFERDLGYNENRTPTLNDRTLAFPVHKQVTQEEHFCRSSHIRKSKAFAIPLIESFLQKPTTFSQASLAIPFKSKYKDKYFESSLCLIRAISVSQSVEFCLQSIVFLYKKRQSFQKIHEYIFARLACNKYVKGGRILCSGRLGGRSKSDMRSKKQSAHFGETALTMFSSRLAFAHTGVDTSFGKIGIKLWICYR